MLSRHFFHSAQLRVTRSFTRSSIIRNVNKDNTPAQKNETENIETPGNIGSRMHRVTNFDKKILVWVKRYPSIADVPKDVSEDCILTARSRARIKACYYMMFGTIIGCIISVILGKRSAARGDNLFKQRQDWFEKQLNQDKNK